MGAEIEVMAEREITGRMSTNEVIEFHSSTELFQAFCLLYSPEGKNHLWPSVVLNLSPPSVQWEEVKRDGYAKRPLLESFRMCRRQQMWKLDVLYLHLYVHILLKRLNMEIILNKNTVGSFWITKNNKYISPSSAHVRTKKKVIKNSKLQ